MEEVSSRSVILSISYSRGRSSYRSATSSVKKANKPSRDYSKSKLTTIALEAFKLVTRTIN